jgi:outer membrane protein TolC
MGNLGPTKRRPFLSWAAAGLGFASLGLAGCQSVREWSVNLAPPAVETRAFPKEEKLSQTEDSSTKSTLVLASFQMPDAPAVMDLATALRLAGVDNPTIRLAQERIQEALAGQLGARSLLLPSINVGTNFRLHRGAYQDDPGFLIQPNSQGLFVGAGAGAIGTGAVAIPGVWLFSYLADSIYEPIVASQRVSENRADAQGVQNVVLLNVATGYLQVVAANGRLEILRRAEADVGEIARITAAFAKSGEGVDSDARRAAANLELVRRQIHEAEGDVQAASARLSGLLSQNPTSTIRTPGDIVESFRLVEEDADLEALIAAAIRSRPELAARAAEIDEAQTRLRQERARPWLPLVAVGYSAGLFGGGSNLVSTNFSSLQDRADFSVLAAWNIQNMGMGNRADVSRARAVVGQANAGYQSSLNQVRKEVAEAQAAAKTAARQVEVAKTAVSIAEEGFRLDADRIKLGQGRPIEALDSFRQLLSARLEILRAIIAFDVAQFRLWVALGSTPEPVNPRQITSTGTARN